MTHRRALVARGWIAGAASCLLLAGCANPLAFFAPPKEGPLFRDPALTLQAAEARAVRGQTTRDDLLGELGPAASVRFEGGFEVWAWRGRSAQGPSEFVVLFGPDGVVRKQRTRIGSAAPG